MRLRNIPGEPGFIKSGVEGRGNNILICKFNIDFSKCLQPSSVYSNSQWRIEITFCFIRFCSYFSLKPQCYASVLYFEEGRSVKTAVKQLLVIPQAPTPLPKGRSIKTVNSSGGVWPFSAAGSQQGVSHSYIYIYIHFV